MSLLPLLIAFMLTKGDGASAISTPGAAARTKKKRGPWPSPTSPPPSGLAIPPMAPMPPMPAADSGTPLGDLHSASKASNEAVEAARALLNYLHGGSPDWGFPGRPSTAIAVAQKRMGDLTTDGIYGPKTQTRGSALLGQAFPARPNAKNAAASAAKNAAKNKAKTLLSKGVPKLHFP